VFTARYGLSPHITWIRLVLKGVKDSSILQLLPRLFLSRKSCQRVQYLPRTSFKTYVWPKPNATCLKAHLNSDMLRSIQGVSRL